jgi:hypothetical protein
VDVVGVDGRKRPGSGLADQPEVIGEREQAVGFFSFGLCVVLQQVADGTPDTRGVGRFEPGDQVVLAVGQVRAVCADKVSGVATSPRKSRPRGPRRP